MKGDREIQLDNQPSPSRVLRGSRNRTHKLPDAKTTTRRKSLNDNNRILSTSHTENSVDSGYSSQTQSPSSSGEQFLMEFNLQSPQMLMTSPVRRRRLSGSSQRSKHHGRNQRYAGKRRSLPVIFEQEDAVISPPSPTTSLSPSPHRKLHNKNRSKVNRRPSSVSDAVIGASYSFPGVRRKGSTLILDRNGLKKRISTLADGVVTGGRVIPVASATSHASRRTSEVYSVIPRKSHLPRYGFIIQRNPYTPPPSNRRRLSNATITGYPHQVRRQSTITIDEINNRLTRAKLERKDSKVRFSVVEDAGSTPTGDRRGSITNRSDGNESVSQVAESVYSSSSASDSSSSGSDSSSSEWTTDSSDSGSDSDSESNTDSSYTTTSSSSTSTSSDSDSSSDDSSSDGSSSDSDSSDEDESSATSRSTSRSTFYTTDSSDMTSETSSTTGSTLTDNSSVIASSVATGMTGSSSKTESSGKTRTSSRSSSKSERSSSSSSRSSSTASGQTESRRSSALSRSTSRSSFRSSSSSPIKSRRSSVSTRASRSSSLERPPSRSMSIYSENPSVTSSPKSSPSIKRKDSTKSKKSRTRGDEKHRTKSDKSEVKKEKAERRKSNGHLIKPENSELLLAASGDDISVVSTPAVIVHKATQDRLELPSSNVSAACVIL